MCGMDRIFDEGLEVWDGWNIKWKEFRVLMQNMVICGKKFGDDNKIIEDTRVIADDTYNSLLSERDVEVLIDNLEYLISIFKLPLKFNEEEIDKLSDEKIYEKIKHMTKNEQNEFQEGINNNFKYLMFLHKKLYGDLIFNEGRIWNTFYFLYKEEGLENLRDNAKFSLCLQNLSKYVKARSQNDRLKKNLLFLRKCIRYYVNEHSLIGKSLTKDEKMVDIELPKTIKVKESEIVKFRAKQDSLKLGEWILEKEFKHTGRTLCYTGKHHSSNQKAFFEIKPLCGSPHNILINNHIAYINLKYIYERMNIENKPYPQFLDAFVFEDEDGYFYEVLVTETIVGDNLYDTGRKHLKEGRKGKFFDLWYQFLSVINNFHEKGVSLSNLKSKDVLVEKNEDLKIVAHENPSMITHVEIPINSPRFSYYKQIKLLEKSCFTVGMLFFNDILLFTPENSDLTDNGYNYNVLVDIFYLWAEQRFNNEKFFNKKKMLFNVFKMFHKNEKITSFNTMSTFYKMVEDDWEGNLLSILKYIKKNHNELFVNKLTNEEIEFIKYTLTISSAVKDEDDEDLFMLTIKFIKDKFMNLFYNYLDVNKLTEKEKERVQELRKMELMELTELSLKELTERVERAESFL